MIHKFMTSDDEFKSAWAGYRLFKVYQDTELDILDFFQGKKTGFRLNDVIVEHEVDKAFKPTGRELHSTITHIETVDHSWTVFQIKPYKWFDPIKESDL